MKNWVDRLDARLDAIGANLAKKEVHIPTDLAGGILFFLFAIVILLVTPQQVTISEKDIINGRMFPRLLTVSYTHLDVYKRQVQAPGQIDFSYAFPPLGLFENRGIAGFSNSP